MIYAKKNPHAIQFDLDKKPLSIDDIQSKKKHLQSIYFSNLSFILAIVVLGAGIAYRAISLDYDKNMELFKISLYIGMWFGLFTGFMIEGNARRKLQMIAVAIIISSSAGLFASMLVTMIVGQLTTWITSVNILASALSCMWVLTHYDEVLKALESVGFVDQKQFLYIKKAASHFEELSLFSEKIMAENRIPLMGEYWAFREWVQSRKEKSSES